MARRTPPRVTRSVGTALLGVAALAVAGWATVSGLYVFLGDGEATKIAASLVAGVGLAVWGSARAWFSGALTGLGAEDWLALGSCLLLGLALTASVFTGESVGLASRPELATLPWLVMGTLVLSAAVYGLLGGASGDGRT